jgi:hypothetical protein
VDPDFRDAWVEALERLELDVERAEALLAAEADPAPGTAAWAPPEMRAPLPADLEPRARLLLERQLAVAARLTEQVTATGRQQRLTERIRGTAHPDVPVYLDLRA